MSLWPGQKTSSFLFITPSVNAASATIILKVEPGGYVPWTVLLASGLYLLSFKASQSVTEIPFTNLFGSNVGADASANISPLLTSITTAAELSPCIRSVANLCKSCPIVSCKLTPGNPALSLSTRITRPTELTSIVLNPAWPLSGFSIFASMPFLPIWNLGMSNSGSLSSICDKS